MEAVRTSETCVQSNETAQRYIIVDLSGWRKEKSCLAGSQPPIVYTVYIIFKVTDNDVGCRILDGSAHLMSRVLVTQSASVELDTLHTV
jgi:hypothetical protein